MTRLILCLPSRSVQSPTRLDLADLESIMLWPGRDDDEDRDRADEAARERAMRAAEVQYGRDNWSLWPSDLQRDLMAQAVESASPAVLMAEAKDRAVEGFVAGTILYRAVRYNEVDPSKAAIGKTVAELSKGLGPKQRLRPQTINNKVIPGFRRVVHFWAAHVAFTLNKRNDLTDAKQLAAGDPSPWSSPFPCRISELAAFLSTAEAFRQRAESIRLPHAARPLMDVGQAVEIPADLSLPTVDLEFL